ncbi:MAG: GNAT family N-acetyltransferase [Gammaproteobacteria bacterium]
MKPALAIRTATAADAGTLMGLIRALAEYEKLLDQVEADEDRIAAALSGSPPPVAALVAEADGRPVGFALYFRNFSTFLGRQGLYLEDLFVLPEWRGRGVGRRLMQALATEARRFGARRMDWSVLDWNAPAISFYRAIGGEPTRAWQGWRLEGDALEALAADDD